MRLKKYCLSLVLACRGFDYLVSAPSPSQESSKIVIWLDAKATPASVVKQITVRAPMRMPGTYVDVATLSISNKGVNHQVLAKLRP